MTGNRVLNLVEALSGSREKIGILSGFLSIGCLALFIYLFGTQAKFSWMTITGYLLFTALFLYVGYGMAEKNAWFVRLFMFLSGFQLLLSLAGWIWVLFLAQENPGGRYADLVTLPFYTFILFFLFTFLTTFGSLMFSLLGLRKKNKPH